MEFKVTVKVLKVNDVNHSCVSELIDINADTIEDAKLLAIQTIQNGYQEFMLDNPDTLFEFCVNKVEKC